MLSVRTKIFTIIPDVSCRLDGRRNFSFNFDSVIIGTLAATSSAAITFFLKQRQIDSIQNELQFRQHRIIDLESQLSKFATIDVELKTTIDELGKKKLEAMELRSSFEKIEALFKAETVSRQKVEEDLSRKKDKIVLLETNLDQINRKYVDETRQLSECRGQLESARATVLLSKEQADREKEARVSLEKTIETSLKLNIERIRDELVSKTREVVGTGVVETLKSSLRQTPVLGRFGEIQLDYLLCEYFTLGELKLFDKQITLESKKRLDAVLKLPTEDGVLHIIIDAKSPNIFDTSVDPDSGIPVTELKKRIVEVLGTLSKANYVEYYRRHLDSIRFSKTQNSAATKYHVSDFILMFLPMDYALLAIDEKLLQKCLEAKVIICTPSLLILQVEFIKMAWRQKLPSDAIVHVEEDFTALGNSLQTLTKDLERCGSSLNAATMKAAKANSRLKDVVADIFANATANR